MTDYRRALVAAIAFHYVWSAGNGYDTLDAEQDAWDDSLDATAWCEDSEVVGDFCELFMGTREPFSVSYV